MELPFFPNVFSCSLSLSTFCALLCHIFHNLPSLHYSFFIASIFALDVLKPYCLFDWAFAFDSAISYISVPFSKDCWIWDISTFTSKAWTSEYVFETFVFSLLYKNISLTTYRLFIGGCKFLMWISKRLSIFTDDDGSLLSIFFPPPCKLNALANASRFFLLWESF